MDPGRLREVVVVESPRETQNAVGELVVEWVPFLRRRASIEQIGFYQSLRAQQISADVTHIVTMHYTDGITGAMRLRWESRGDRMLYISSIVEQGHRQWHELTCEERANG